jgi:hypothetical protein
MVRFFRPGASTIGIDVDGPRADLGSLEAELLSIEGRIAREGGRVAAALFRIRDVSAVFNGPGFVRFVRAYVDRTPTFVRAAVYVERSFVVRTIVDPIAILAPRLNIRTFSSLEPCSAFLREVDPTFQMPPLPAHAAAG